jgi:hypothetical protein
MQRVVPVRTPTRPSRAAVERRLRTKAAAARKKASRRAPNADD